MSHWIEIPPMRIFEVEHREIVEHFTVVGVDGGGVDSFGKPYRYIRSDGKVFKPARFVPADLGGQCCYLEEL